MNEDGSLVPLRPGRDQSVGQPPPSEAAIGDTSAIALSGGGYRAMLFHLGFLWRMRDAGMLQGIDRFSSVSGGSIDVVGALIGRIPGMSGSWVRRAYDKHLFKGKRLAELTKRPRFIFNATSLHSGKLVRINQDYFADWSTGRWDVGDMTVATAVTASSAFPPVLSPIVVDLSGHRSIPAPGTIYKAPAKLFLVSSDYFIQPRPLGGIEFSEPRARSVAATRTCLSKFAPELSKQLVNWGYVATDDRLRTGGYAIGQCRLPYPECPLA